MKKVIKLLESSMLLKYKNCNKKWLVLEHEFGKDNECEELMIVMEHNRELSLFYSLNEQ